MDFHDDTTREPGHFARLVTKVRQDNGITQEELAERAGFARGTVIAIEKGHSLASLAACLKLAKALGMPRRQALEARALDEVHDDPDEQRELAAEFDGGAAWLEATQLYMRVRHALLQLEVSDPGDLAIDRHYKGCTPPRPLNKLVFRDRIRGANPSHIEIQRVPIGYDVASRTNAGWREHHIDFHQPWTNGELDLRFRVNLDKAFVLDDVDEYTRRFKADGLPVEPPRGVYRFYLPYAFEEITLDITFPRFYRFDWDDPIATPDRAPVEDQHHLPLDLLAHSFDWTPRRHGARLTLRRPRTGNTVYLIWRPRHPQHQEGPTS